MVLNNVTFDAKSGDHLEDVSMEILAPKVVAICSEDDGPVLALEQLLLSVGNIVEGSAQINRQDTANFKRHPEKYLAVYNMMQLKGKTVEKAITHAIKKVEGALDVKQTLQLLVSLGIKYDDRISDMTVSQREELKIVALLAMRRPVVLLADALDQLTDSSREVIAGLIKDYAQKTDSVVFFSSRDISTMMRYANTIYYFSGNHLTSARDISMNDTIDCTVTITGTGLPVDAAINMGAHILEESENRTRLLFAGNIQALLPLLEQSTITDVRIEDATVDDELMAY
ncbi:MAG: multidrug ABC transporter ATPase [Limosilactobacillus sp.]|uniref:multidrug ABC transporter ATPase n=1 Tax=Limosilactobacillus sp. TaxID=2773925 RepID=UPI00270A0C1B|nr:multidrug ABC transporter ATPase [Limosilactobacillus sp.]